LFLCSLATIYNKVNASLTLYFRFIIRKLPIIIYTTTCTDFHVSGPLYIFSSFDKESAKTTFYYRFVVRIDHNDDHIARRRLAAVYFDSRFLFALFLLKAFKKVKSKTVFLA
jgi:hypothetical protein